MNPTEIVASQNRFAILANTDDTDDDNTALPQRHSCSLTTAACPPRPQDLPQTSPQDLTCQNSALSDSGATGHFLIEGAHAINIQPDPDPITVTLPDGRTIQSTHPRTHAILTSHGSAEAPHRRTSYQASPILRWSPPQNFAMQGIPLYSTQ